MEGCITKKEARMKILKWLDKNFEEKLMMVMLMAMVIIMGLQVLCRKVFNNSLSWTEEITRFLFVWLTFLSIGYCISKGIALKIDQAVLILPKKAQKIILILVTLISAIYLIYMIPQAWNYMMTAIQRGQKSSATRINMAWVQGSTVVGFFCGALRSVQQLYFLIKKKESGGDD